MPTCKLAQETALVERLYRREDRAFTRLHELYAASLRTVLLRRTRNEMDAEDLLQEVFVRAYTRIESYKAQQGRLRSWLVNIARNLAIDHYRGQQIRPKPRYYLSDEAALLTVDRIYYTSPASLDLAELLHLVDRLPAPDALLIRRIYVEGYTQEQAALALGQPIGTIKTRTRRILLTLKPIINRYYAHAH